MPLVTFYYSIILLLLCFMDSSIKNRKIKSLGLQPSLVYFKIISQSSL